MCNGCVLGDICFFHLKVTISCVGVYVGLLGAVTSTKGHAHNTFNTPFPKH